MGILIFIILLLCIPLYFLYTGYNSLQESGQKIKEARSNILVMLKKRKMLIEQLADVVKSYAGHEMTLLTQVSHDQSFADSNLVQSYRDSTALFASLQTVAQRFPAIKADAQFSRYMNDITSIETELQKKRELYNQLVQGYNASKRKLPMVIFAQKMGFEDAPYLDFDQEESLDKIKDFKVDEGEGIQNFVNNSTNAVKNAASTAGHKAASLGKAAIDKADEIAEETKAKFRKSKYRYSKKGVISDPVSFSELEKLLAKGEITEKTNVLEEGGKEWVKFGTLLPQKNDEVIPPPPPDEE